ncbi:MAG TPA: acetylglutamate kinase [Bryobacteraceae bacterium]|nr:acetylglutamate kinase [Bryobacteraceae bacterium]
MKVLIKLGGTLLEAPESRRRLACEIAGVFESGVAAVVVHGGGKQMTRFLEERGVKSTFVNGLRVTSAEVLDAVVKVVAGSLNQELVAAFAAAGVPAVGLSGVDAGLAEAEQLNPELGFVGKPVRSNPKVLEVLTSNRLLPVVACVAGDRAGNMYNVNADQMAVACARAFGVDKLLFLTDVEGVRSAAGEILPKLSAGECRQLIADGVATGGMQAKLESAISGLAAGIGEVVIAPGARPGVVGELVAGHEAGTRIS